MRLFRAIGTILACIGLIACGDTSKIGSTILTDEIAIVMDSSFTATGYSVTNARVQSRTTTQLLGIIEAAEYGNFSSEFVTQFMPAGEIDTTGLPVENIDSVMLIMMVPNGALVGDSVVPMGLQIYPLKKSLPSPIYSDFDPEGYYDPNEVIATQIYACNAMNESDSVASLDARYLWVKLPLELGTKLYEAYLQDPSMYLSPSEFTSLFPGLYVANSFGSGRVMRINSTILRLYFHRNGISSTTGNDTTFYGFGNYYAVTPEIITNNDISYKMAPGLQSMINEGRQIISAPTGADVEMIFPAQDIISSYLNGAGTLSVVNTLSLSIPVKEIKNDYSIDPPANMLLVLKSKKDEFFENNDLADDETSFYSTYNSSTRTYEFTGMRDYLLMLLEKGNITPEDYTFVLTPVTLNMGLNTGYYGSSTYIESIAPYVDEPSMAELDLKNAKIILTYSRQSTKN